MRKFILFFLTIFGIFYLLIGSFLAQTQELSQSGNLRVLVLEGKPFDRGIQHGRALKDDIHKLVNLWKQDLEKTYQTDADVFIKDFLDKTSFQDAIQKWIPELHISPGRPDEEAFQIFKFHK